jgi:hypothetical protein
MRAANFSSSNAWKLMTNDKSGKPFGSPGKSYIKQVNYERMLGRSINADRDSRPTTWGTFVERRAFDLLPLDYQLISSTRLYHPSLPLTGMPDLRKENIVADAKCPFSLEVFCDKLSALSDLELYKKLFPEDYWQHISNSVLLEAHGFNINSFEAVIYVPFKSELDDIRIMVQNYTGEDMYRFKWIAFANDEEMPYILEDGRFRNLNVVKHDIPFLDKQAFIERVELASKELIELNKTVEV